MLKVNSKKTIKRISDRNFRSNQSRNIIAILAVSLTTILFTAIFTIGSGMIENFQRQTMRQAGGDGMGVLKYITDEEYNKIKDHKLIKEISYNRILASSVNNKELLKRHGEFYYMDNTAMKLGFCEPTTGNKPQAENEIIMDTKAIKLFGIEPKIGAPITLNLTIHGKEVSRDFVLSGWWEADPAFNVSIIVASQAYMEAHIDELYNSLKKDRDLTGVINSYIMFDNSFNLEDKLSRVITESGYSLNETDSNYIANNVNWAYLSTNFGLDFGTVLGISAALLLIILTGYLIIYNIFQISVLKDIRFYGLLKTIGTTGKQIKKIIRRQAFVLSCIGIPIGLILGYFIGCSMVPIIMKQTIYSSGNYQTSANLIIFIGSTIFAFITILLSTTKPGRIAAHVSPIEAVRYTDNHTKLNNKERKSKHGAKIIRMAASNLGRNKKRTILVLLSISLSLVLFNTVYTFSIGFDMDKFLSKFVDTDYLIAHADYFNYNFSGPENSVSETMIQSVQQQSGFEEGGRLYGNIRDTEYFSVENTKPNVIEDVDSDGNIFCAVYGLEDLPLERLQVLEGEIDLEKLKSGNYILEGITLDDHDNPEWETSHYSIGDTVTLHNYKGTAKNRLDNEFTTYRFTVMAKVAVKTYTNSCGSYYPYTYYLPADVYKEMVAVPGIMSYVYNISHDEETNMETFLQNYTENIEPIMNFSSKSTKVKEFEGMKNMILIVGGTLSLIIGLIGILNFINSMLTSIIARRMEFAMLQSIGMTTKQLQKMLIAEGFYYTATSGVLSILLGILLSAIIVQTFSENLWFFSYHFTILPLLLIIPILLIVGILLPCLVLRTVKKQSIVDRLRETES